MSTFSRVYKPYTFGGEGGLWKSTFFMQTFNFLAWFLLFSWGYLALKKCWYVLFLGGGGGLRKCWYLWMAPYCMSQQNFGMSLYCFLFTTLPNVLHVYYMCETYVIHVWCFCYIINVIHTHVIHVLNTCNTVELHV